jgi:hypothetical protein
MFQILVFFSRLLGKMLRVELPCGSYRQLVVNPAYMYITLVHNPERGIKIYRKGGRNII